MKPVQDTFTNHIQGLYDGHEVAPPQGMQESVFNKLDSSVNSGVSGSTSLTSKAILGAAVVLIGFAWFLMPVTEEVVVEEVVVEEVVVEEVVVEEVVVVEEAVNTVIVDDAQVTSTVAVPTKNESIETSNTSVEVKENIVLTEEIVTPSIVATPPVEVVQDTEEEKKEAIEWVLPAKLKVDE
jgi:hypothetical protein